MADIGFTTAGAAGGGGSGDTELPAAAALTDVFANPTAPAVGSFTMFWESGVGTWKRWRSVPVTNPTGFEAPSVQLVGIGGFGLSEQGSLVIGGQPDSSASDGPTVESAAELKTFSPARVYNAGTFSFERARVASGDNMAATGIPASGLMAFDGTNWDRLRVGTTAGSLLVNNPTAANFLATVTLDAASLAALESITVQNAAGASAVNIQDGGNSITVDGTVGVSGSVDTELPAAAALADNMANPTAPAVGSFNMVWDGATWDRWDRSVTDGSGSLTVDAPVGTPVFVRLSDGASAISALPVTDNAGSLTVDAPVGTPVFARLSDGTAALGTGNGTAASALRVSLASDGTGVVRLTDGTTATSVIAATAALKTDTSSVAGTATVTSAAGVQKVGIASGATGNSFVEATAANLSATSGAGAMVSTSPGQWAIQHSPAANTKATITKAAGAAGVRHVCTSISFSFVTGTTAPTAIAPILVNLRDGATGTGTILQSWYVPVPVTTNLNVITFGLADLNIVGSAATAMTLEFSAAGGANTFEAVNLVGYDIS